MDHHNYLLTHLCPAKETVVDFEDRRVVFAVISEYYNTVLAVNMSAF
jgi:hypothetical protein